MSQLPTPSQLFAQARQSLQNGHTEAAIRLASAARTAFAAAGAHDHAVRSAILQSRCEAAAGLLEPAADTLHQAMAHAERFATPAEALAARSELGVLQEQMGQLLEALATHRAVLEAQEGRKDRLGTALAAANVARLLPRAALPEHRKQARKDAQDLLLQSGRMFIECGKSGLAAQALVVVGDQLRAEGEFTKARAVLRDAQRSAELAGDLRVQASATLNLVYVLRDLGDREGANLACQQAKHLAEVGHDKLAALQASQARLLLTSGELPAPKTVEFIQDTLLRFEEAGYAAASLPLRANLGLAMARTGQLRQAIRILQGVRADLGRAGERLALSEVDLALAELYWTCGDEASAVAMLARLPAEQVSPKLRNTLALLQARRALAHLDLGSARAALDHAKGAEISHADKIATSLFHGQMNTLIGHRIIQDYARVMAYDEDLSPREGAARRLLMAIDEAWHGERQDAERSGHEALAQWVALGEPLPQATCRVVLTCLGQAPDADLRALLELLDREQLTEAHTALNGALCAQAHDLPGVLSAIDSLRTSGWTATALTLTRLSRLAMDMPQLLDLEASIWASAGVVASDLFSDADPT